MNEPLKKDRKNYGVDLVERICEEKFDGHEIKTAFYLTDLRSQQLTIDEIKQRLKDELKQKQDRSTVKTQQSKEPWKDEYEHAITKARPIGNSMGFIIPAELLPKTCEQVYFDVNFRPIDGQPSKEEIEEMEFNIDDKKQMRAARKNFRKKRRDAFNTAVGYAGYEELLSHVAYFNRYASVLHDVKTAMNVIKRTLTKTYGITVDNAEQYFKNEDKILDTVRRLKEKKGEKINDESPSESEKQMLQIALDFRKHIHEQLNINKEDVAKMQKKSMLHPSKFDALSEAIQKLYPNHQRELIEVALHDLYRNLTAQSMDRAKNETDMSHERYAEYMKAKQYRNLSNKNLSPQQKLAKQIRGLHTD